MHRVQKRNHSIFRMRMAPDETITGHFPAGTNDPKRIKLVPGRTIQSLLIEFFLDPYESLVRMLTRQSIIPIFLLHFARY